MEPQEESPADTMMNKSSAATAIHTLSLIHIFKPVMLADGIGDAFRFDFAGAAVNVGLLLVLWRVEVNVCLLYTSQNTPVRKARTDV